MQSMGTLTWADKTGGKLGFLDKTRFMTGAFRASLKRNPSKAELIPAGISPDELDIPHSSLTENTLNYAHELCEPWLINHSFRTYFWAQIFARSRHLKYDPELLFAAAILHDLGLTKEFENGIDGEHCFAVTGASAASEFLGTQTIEQHRNEIICEAIALHLNLSVDIAHGTEAHLLHAGTAFDTIRLGRREIRKDAINTIFELHPQSDMKKRLVCCLAHQKQIRPHSRVALLMRMGFGDRISRAK